MKNFKLFIVVLSLFIVSCDTDDIAPFDLNTQNFSGIYEITAFSSTDTESFTTDGETTVNSYNSVGSDFVTTWTFANNNTFTLTGTFTITDTGEENGVVFSESYQETLNESGIYTLDVLNETILLDFIGEEDGEAQLFNITSFSEDNISLFYTESQLENSFTSEYMVDIDLARK